MLNAQIDVLIRDKKKLQGSFLRIKIGLAGPSGVHDPSLKGPYVTGSDVTNSFLVNSQAPITF